MSALEQVARMGRENAGDGAVGRAKPAIMSHNDYRRTRPDPLVTRVQIHCHTHPRMHVQKLLHVGGGPNAITLPVHHACMLRPGPPKPARAPRPFEWIHQIKPRSQFRSSFDRYVRAENHYISAWLAPVTIDCGSRHSSPFGTAVIYSLSCCRANCNRGRGFSTCIASRSHCFF